MQEPQDWIANARQGMSRRQFLAGAAAGGLGVVVLPGLALAADAVPGEIIRTPVDGLDVADIAVPAGDFAIPCYEARPAPAGRYPVVIVIPEIFGMHEYIRDVTRRFAREGFLALTFEPYARDGGVSHLSDRESLMRVVNAVPDARVMGDLDALVVYLRQHPSARPEGIGVTGFCRGGLYSMLFAAHSQAVRAAVPWYGQIKPALSAGVRTAGPLDVAARIRVPVLGLYGEEDLGIPVADVREMEAALRSAGTSAEFVLYPGAPHAFHADYRPSYREAAARDAWSRCVRFLHERL